MAPLKPGRYRHYKGNEYLVLEIARHSETMEELVVYRALYGERGLWVRPRAMFQEDVVIEGKTQYIVRASRELGSDRMSTTVGPIGVEIVEPLRKTHVYTERNEHGLSFDMVFEGVTEPFQEPHFLRRVGNRIFMDSTRLF